MKFLLSSACVALIVGAQGVHAGTSGQTSPEVMAFLENPTHCSVLIGGADRAGDGADRTYAESLNKAFTALGGPLPSAAEWMRSACAHRPIQSASSAKAAP
ncbi:MAG: hypothetical protein EON54_04595 [Alcaligenaceae bacterium]|nr:MAG: hypothetical protein EON54_04595 [Alcaligenaceae bacterium]